ncbi:hypothetical protein ACJ4V0_15640 [Phreatobacter sp. HK31-P]
MILTLVRTDNGLLVPTVNGEEITGCQMISVQANPAGGVVTLQFTLADVDFTVETPEQLHS